MRENGLKLTRQRQAIIDVIAGTRSHPSAQDVLVSARKKAPKISLSTVYHTLDVMKRAGLIKELEFTDRDNRYEGDISDHLNLVCRGCGEIIDFPTPLPPALKDVEKKTGFRGDCVRFDYCGYCRKCQRNRG